MIVRVQSCELREVAELRWEGAVQLIRLDIPESDNERMEHTRIDNEINRIMANHQE